MRPLVGSLLVVGLVVAWAEGADPQDQLYASWQEAQRGVQSLVIEFNLETMDRIFEDRQKALGTLRLIRTQKGDVLASYQVTQPRAKSDKQKQLNGLLSNGMIYLLNPDKKTAIRFGPEGGDLRQFLELHFNPFVMFLDRKSAEEKCYLEIVKQDKPYTYVAVKPREVNQNGWLPDTFHEGRAILMNKASADIPKDMPRQLWYTNGTREYTFEIKAWRLNPADSPNLEEFMRPEDRLGWTVSEWPFRRK